MGGRQVHTLAGHTDMVPCVAFSLDGTRIVSGSYDELVKIWNSETGAEVCEPGGGATTFLLLAMAALVFWP